MNSLLRKYWYLTVVAVLFFASASLAQTTSVTLTGVGDGATLGDVYVDPYTATVGGVANTSVICDDWSNNSYVNESWTANVTNVAAVGSSGSPMFGNNSSLYNEVAWLGSQLLANPKNTTMQTEISFAIWDLTYGANNTYMDPTNPLTYLSANGTSSEYAQTLLLISEAEGEGTYNSSGWEILTPNSGDPTCSGSPCPSSPPQEFLVYTPESSAVILFGADMLGLLGLAIVFRRRLLRPVL